MAAQGRLWRRVRRQRAGLVPDHRRAHLHHPPHPADLDDPRALRPAASAAPGWGATLDHISGGRWGINVVTGHREVRAPRLRHGTDRARPALRTGGRIRRRAATAVARGRAAVLQRPLVMETAGCLCHAKPRYARPLLVSATGSDAGIAYAARHSDVVFITSPRVGLRQRDRGPARPRRTREGRRARRRPARAHAAQSHGDQPRDRERDAPTTRPSSPGRISARPTASRA